MSRLRPYLPIFSALFTVLEAAACMLLFFGLLTGVAAILPFLPGRPAAPAAPPACRVFAGDLNSPARFSGEVRRRFSGTTGTIFDGDRRFLGDTTWATDGEARVLRSAPGECKEVLVRILGPLDIPASANFLAGDDSGVL